MKSGRRKRSKDTWYVSFQSLEHVGERSRILRTTETFPNERDAKAFAEVRLADGSSINAGTLNPHLPKRTITSTQLLDWLNEPEGAPTSARISDR
jgi:hypothetical protein